MDESIWDDCIQQAVRLVCLAHERFERLYDEQFKDTFTATQFFALTTLLLHGEMSMTALAARMGVPKQQATRIMAQLCGGGYVLRGEDTEDRRVVRVSLSGYARERLRAGLRRGVSQLLATSDGARAAEHMLRVTRAAAELADTLEARKL